MISHFDTGFAHVERIRHTKATASCLTRGAGGGADGSHGTGFRISLMVQFVLEGLCVVAALKSFGAR